MYQVVVGTDSTGEFVMLVHPEDELLGGEGVRFKLAFQSDDYALAVQAAALVDQRLKTPRAGSDERRS